METFITFFFCGPNWFWHFLLLLILIYTIKPEFNINQIVNGNNGKGETPEDGQESSQE